MMNSSSTSLEDKRACKRGVFVQVVPLKRRAQVESPRDIEPVNGNRFPIYDEIIPIIKRAMRNGMEEVDLATASIAETSVIMRKIRRNPRQHVAAFGVPDLSDIMDAAEPESPTLIKRPILKAELRSPQKRIARLASPFKKSIRRLTDSVVKLVPGNSPRAEPSPTKSDSVPSTPLRHISSPLKPAITPSGIDATPSKSNMSLSEHQSMVESPLQPGRTFRCPSYADSSSLGSSLELTGHQSPSTNEMSPVKRPIAPTPSRWNRTEPSTPNGFSPLPVKALSPFLSTPVQMSSAFNVGPLATTPTEIPQFTFTAPPNSPRLSFGHEDSIGVSSPSWINIATQASESRRTKIVTSTRRRRSEPLFRHFLKNQTRRQSTSPEKLIFQENDLFHFNEPTESFLSSTHSNANESVIADVPAQDSTAAHEAFSMAVDVDASTASMNQDEDTISVINEVAETDQPEPVDETPAIVQTPQQTPNHHERRPSTSIEPAVLTIDMRQNPDIFGTQASSPPASIQQLSLMAEDACAGNARVVVDHECDRLFVRFKLSTEYAHLFPSNQGFDESRFTSTPSVNNSPRLTFKTHPCYQAQPWLSSSPTKLDRTPALPSPHGPSFSDSLSTMATPSHGMSTRREAFVDELLQTPSMIGLGIIKSGSDNSASFLTPELPQNENTLLFCSPNIAATPSEAASTIQGSGADAVFQTPRIEVSDHTLQFPSFAASPMHDLNSPSAQQTPSVSTSALPKTPDITGLGIIITASTRTMGFQTPELPHVDNTIVFGSAAQIDVPHTPTLMHTSQDANDVSPVVTWTPVEATASSQATETPTQVADSMRLDSVATPSRADETLIVSWTPVAKTPMPHMEETPVKAAEPTTDDEGSPTAPHTPTPVDSPTAEVTVTSSFIPVKQTTPTAQVAETPVVAATTVKKTLTPTEQTETAPVAAVTRKDYDSPGRAYMRDFIKRARQTSAIETGSPIAPATKRQPLGVRSPNAASPQKTKRKHIETEDENQSPAKKAEDDGAKAPTPKRARRTKVGGRPKEEPTTEVVEESAREAENPETLVADAEPKDAPATRRSTRLRTQTQAGGAAKSSIPTAIKLNRAGGAVLNSTVRNEQQELTHQTRSNTKRNQGGAEYPAVVVARLEATKGGQGAEAPEASGEAVSVKSGKSVGWREPLESVQGKAKGGEAGIKRGAAKPAAKTIPKVKATLGKTGIAKPKSSSAATKRATKVAENLGMVANGTPVKPQRMTRSRTRSQV